MTPDPWPVVPPAVRVDRTRATIQACAFAFDTWLTARRADDRFAAFAPHFDVLEPVLHGLLSLAGDGLTTLSGAPVFVRCRGIEDRVALVRRLFGWYRQQYDQRLDPLHERNLRAADAVARTALHAPFDRAAAPRLLDPLVAFDATPTRSLRGAIAALPIPVVSVPAAAVLQPWQLVYAVHSAARHVHHRLLARSVDEAVIAPWTEVMVADTIATLTLGPSAARAFADLHYGPPDTLLRASRTSGEPPLAARLALHGEVGRAVGLDDPGPGAAEVEAWLDGLALRRPDPVHARARAVVRETPGLAAALLAAHHDGLTLPTLCGFDPARFGPGGDVERWRAELTLMHPSTDHWATSATSGIAAAVTLWTHDRPDPSTLALATRNLLLLLPTTFTGSAVVAAPSAVVAAPSADMVRSITERVAAHLATGR